MRSGACPVLPSNGFHHGAHQSYRVGIQVGQHTFTDIDYADDVVLLVDKEESFRTALAAMDDEASKFGLRVSDQDKDPESWFGFDAIASNRGGNGRPSSS